MSTPTTAIGIDFGGTSIKSAVVRGGAICPARRSHRSAGVRVFRRSHRRLVRMSSHCAVTHSDVAGVGIGLPGFVDSAHGIVHELTNVAGWDEVPLCQILRDRTGLAAAIENDVNAMTYAEWKHGAARGGKHTFASRSAPGLAAA
jgi:glucokinase